MAIHCRFARSVNRKNHSSWKILATGITSIHGWPIYNKLLAVFSPDRVFGIRPPKALLPDGQNIISGCMTDLSMFEKIKRTFGPTHVVHAAGVCDLDMCEDNPARAYAINTGGTKNIVSVFGDTCHILYVSADLVFSGQTPPSDGYNEDHSPNPISIVGKTYRAAEEEMQNARRSSTIRIGLPMGDSVQGEKGAVDFIEGRFKRNLPMTLFHDEWRSSIHCDELADCVVEMLLREERGLFHLGGPKPVSLYEIGQRIIDKGNYDKALLIKLSRLEEKNGPPRVGNVHLNSSKIEQLLDMKIGAWK
jgi:dTDP-4-dehydrorhamnose reductase